MKNNKGFILKFAGAGFLFISELLYLFVFSGFFSDSRVNYYFYYFGSVKPFFIFLPVITWFFSSWAFFNIIYNKYLYFKPVKTEIIKSPSSVGMPPWPATDDFMLVVGELHNKDGNMAGKPEWLIIDKNGLYTSLLVVGSTGTGKTSACAYPFLDQLISCKKNSADEKIGGLILDVKGDFWKAAMDIITKHGRLDDIIIIEPDSGYFYNPIHYPSLDAKVIAERLYSAMEQVRSNDARQDSYWKDKSINLLSHCLDLLRICFNYVTLDGIYEIISDENKLEDILLYAESIASGNDLNAHDIDNLKIHTGYFRGSDYAGLDERTKAIIKSESLRVCSDFVNPVYKNTFCVPKEKLNFPGFQEIVNKGKIVILRMHESKYGLTGRAVGIMLKLDYFRTVLNRVYNAVTDRSINMKRPVLFICDEYQNYVTSGEIESDSEFFARCRQSKAVNIMLTQSYSSLKLKLGSEEKLNSLIGNIRSTIWLSLSDDYSREKASKICDKEFKVKITENITEQDEGARFNVNIGGLLSDDNTISQGTTKTMEKMPAFDTDDFANLKLNQAIYRIYSGKTVEGPGIVYLHPFYRSKYKSYFDREVS